MWLMIQVWLVPGMQKYVQANCSQHGAVRIDVLSSAAICKHKGVSRMWRR